MVNHHFLNNALTPFYFITIFQANPHHIVGYIRYYIFIRVRIYIYIYTIHCIPMVVVLPPL